MSNVNIDKQIETIWKENSHIPFMQSKDILRLGYEIGLKTKDNNISEQNSVQKSTEKKIYIKASDLDIEESRYKLLDELIDFITKERDLMKTYNKVKEMADISYQKFKSLKQKYKKNE